MKPLIITGIGTDVGKTLVAAIITEALQADYWKPVQAGYENGTDSEWIRNIVTNKKTRIFPETYKLKLAASPHIAAREEGVSIELNKIIEDFKKIEVGSKNENTNTDSGGPTSDFLVVEGAGGLLVPLNGEEFVADLLKKINAGIILVSRNHLGSINHSLLTAKVCKDYGLNVIGWIFNDQYLDYEDEIVHWSGFPKIVSVPFCKNVDKGFIKEQGAIVKPALLNHFSVHSQKLV